MGPDRSTDSVLELLGFSRDRLSGLRDLCNDQFAKLKKQASTAGSTAQLLANELERARLANAIGDVETLRKSMAAAGPYAAAMTIRARLPDGEVRLAGAGVENVTLPPGPAGATPPLWLDGLCCAIALRDTTSLEFLAETEALPAICEEAKRAGAIVGTEPFWQDYARAFIAIMKDDPAAAEYARLAVNAMENRPTGPLDREALRLVDQRALTLLAELAAHRVSNWRQAVHDAVSDFHRCFSEEERSSLTTGYLPLGLLALCAIAFDRGLGLPEPTPYLRAEIVSGEVGPHTTSIDVRYAPRSILSADEAHWFLDLQGYARKGREHRLQNNDTCPTATYTLPAGHGLPPAMANFMLAESAVGGGQPALDAGELVFLAQSFAKECRAGAGLSLAQQRVLLSDAMTCVDAALLRLPENGSVLPVTLVPSERGREVYDAEPGRFRRSRLAAYRDGLAKMLSEYDTAIQKQGEARASAPQDSTAAKGTAESDARATALVLCAVIRAKALVIVDALATDFDGEVRATLRPRDDDYSKVFRGPSAERARQAYESLWSRGLNMDFPTSSQSEILCHVAPAGMFAERNELSNPFPAGYFTIAEQLNPHRIWVTWQYRRPGDSAGLAYDGLVWVDDHWSWFPKPYRYLAG